MLEIETISSARRDLAAAMLRGADLRRLQAAARKSKVWARTYRGFRPDLLSRSVLLTGALAIASNRGMFDDLCSAFLDGLKVGPTASLRDRFASALAIAELPDAAREICSVLSNIDPWDLPLQAALSTAEPPGPSVAEQLPQSRESSGATAEPSSGRESDLLEEEGTLSVDADQPRYVIERVPLDWTPPSDNVGEIQEAVTLFERALIAFVVRQLAGLHGDAWLRRGCGALRNKWREKVGRNRALEPASLIGYADLSDLDEIIRNNGNWGAFQPYFGDKDTVRLRFMDIVPLRVSGMHAGDCAAYELAGRPQSDECMKPFDSLPATFRRMLENELSPSEPIAPDLYPLKQRAQAGPQREFALRTAIDQSFKVKTTSGLPLGDLSLSQLLREGYPGAIYYYMGTPFRAFRLRFKNQEVQVRRVGRGISTSPVAQAKVFPQFGPGSFSLLSSPSGFLAETELQVSERVLGFLERRGSGNPTRHNYGPTSVYSQRELNRYFETTGVCWSFSQKYATQTALAQRILEAFCQGFGVQERDLGIGTFYAKTSPVQEGPCAGVCVFDATTGSLRLTQRLMESFAEIVELAVLNAHTEGVPTVEEELSNLGKLISELQQAVPQDIVSDRFGNDENWMAVIPAGERAMWVGPDRSEEVLIAGFRYTPQGLVYDLVDSNPALRRTVFAKNVQPLQGETRLIRVNLLTGETDEGGDA